MRYARQCDLTSEGMNEGWVWSDGLHYTKYYDDTIKILRTDHPTKKELSDDELMEWAVEEEDLLYYTDWEDEDDYIYEEINGVINEI